MLDNYYTLRALVREWQSTLVGREIVEAYSPAKDVLDLLYKNQEEGLGRLRISIRNGSRYAFVQAASKRPKQNLAPIFESLGGQVIDSVSILESDRLVNIALSDGLRLDVHLYGSKSNVFLIKGSTIKESFKKNDDWRNHEAPIPQKRPTTSTTEERDPASLLKSQYGSLASHYRKEVLEQSNELSSDVLEIAKSIQQTIRESQECTVYWEGRRPKLLSLIPLRGKDHLENEVFDSINKACGIVAQRRIRLKRFAEVFDPIHKALSDQCIKRQKAIENLELAMQSASRAEKYQLFGDLLMSQPFQSGNVKENSLTLADLSDENMSHTIKLNPEFSLIDNASQYYEKSKSAKARRSHDLSRLPKMKSDLKNLSSLLDALKSKENLKDLQKFLQADGKKIFKLLPSLMTRAPAQESRFRQFEIDEGYIVLVGKNAKQNDELTLKVSSKEDIWMHARGYAGSHLILKTRGRDDKPSGKVIEKAASVAAHFSKGRSSSLVPVVYTKRKYVSKPKGSAPGAVRVSQEKVILVEPKLPS